MYQVLVAFGANVHCKDRKGICPLKLAVTLSSSSPSSASSTKPQPSGKSSLSKPEPKDKVTIPLETYKQIVSILRKGKSQKDVILKLGRN